MSLLEMTQQAIEPVDQKSRDAVAARQSRLTKPAGSLGRLESLSIQLAGIQRTAEPKAEQGAVFVMAADHGVCEEGVSAFPQEVTAQMVHNFVSGGAAINVLGRLVNARIVVSDVGIASDVPAELPIHIKKIGNGTKNMVRGPAMSCSEAIAAVEAGIEIFNVEYARAAFDMCATGDMGIGNTTASSAIASVITRKSPADLTGRGTGIGDEALRRKIATIEAALEHNKPNPADALDVLAKVGGFEIGALAGVILAASARHVPVILDGYISGAAALIAAGIAPLSVSYMIAGHVSADSGHAAMLNHLGLEPLLNLGLRLGEGTGAALAMNLCRAASRIVREMATFDSAGVAEKVD